LAVAAAIAMMDNGVVNQRQWMSREKLDLLGITNLIPGPNSTELAIHIGYERGWRGLLIAGSCFACCHAHRLGIGCCCLCSLNRSSMAAVWHQACDYCDRASGALLGKKAAKPSHHNCRSRVSGGFAGLNEILLLVLLEWGDAGGENWQRRAP